MKPMFAFNAKNAFNAFNFYFASQCFFEEN